MDGAAHKGKPIDFDTWVDGWSTDAPTTYQGSESLAFQRWFKFKEAFSPALVRRVIDGLPTRPKHILDCFGGSGTTAVVAKLLDIPSTTIEVNPFLGDLIKAKLEDYQNVDLESEICVVLKRAGQLRVRVADVRRRVLPTFIEPGIKSRWIFGRSVAKQIERIKLSIDQHQGDALKRFFRIALGSVLIECSNVRIDGKGRRYRKDWQQRKVLKADVLRQFVANAKAMMADVNRFVSSNSHSCKVWVGDSRALIDKVAEPIDLAIFSPPYPNSFDYTDIYNVELWMLGYLSNSEENGILRKRTLRSHVQTSWEQPKGDLESPALKKLAKKLEKRRADLWDKRLPEMVQAYFEDLNEILASVKSKLSENGRIAIVVGNSSYLGVIVPTNIILEELALQHDLYLERCESVRYMRSSVQQGGGNRVLDEWLLEFSQV